MKRSNRPRILQLLLSGVILLAMGYAALPYFVHDPLEDVLRYDASPLVLDRNGELMHASLSASGEWCIPVSLDKTGVWTSRVAVAIEDKRFWRHLGIDPLAVLRALATNVQNARIVSGASTITTQLIRISDPRERTYATKLSEFARALVLERKLSKDEILELYLNRAPFGGNLRGIEAASRAYYGKSAEQLSLSESTLLLSLLRAPSRLRPDRFGQAARVMRDKNLLFLAERKVVSPEQATAAMQEVIWPERHAFPRTASMAVSHTRGGFTKSTVVNATIDLATQKLLEGKLQTALEGLPPGITAAGIVVDNHSGEVLAYVGNAKHGSQLPGAQVDCGAAPRSPGSTLKPFVYAYAFEKGLLIPSSLLADTPLAFRGSPPRNFDRSYRGPVSSRIALAASLNAPAVRVLRMAGYTGSLQLLRRLGFSGLTQDSAHYYDSLILGGCEVTLIELAAAYRALANKGQFAQLSWTAGHKYDATLALSPAAAYITVNILQDTKRLAHVYQEIVKGTSDNVAFKTGTSYGLRDAWSMGVSPTYTVGVWMGSPDGRGFDELVGLNAATPAMLAIFRDVARGDRLFITPESVVARRFCSLSGALPNRYCDNTVLDLAINGISNMTLCKVHKMIDGEVVLDWPEDLRQWGEKTSQPQRGTVRITRPVNGSRLHLTKGDTGKVFLEAEGASPFYWYLDGRFLDVDKDGSGIFADVDEGVHRLSVLSGEESDRVAFEALGTRDDRPQKRDALVFD